MWMLTKDNDPPRDLEVLILVNGEVNIGIKRYGLYQHFAYWSDARVEGNTYDVKDVSHWQFLPELPRL